MRRLSNSLLGQLVIAVVGSVIATLLFSAFSHLAPLQLTVVALGILCVAEAVIILLERRSRPKPTDPDHPAREKRSPFGETMWTEGWKNIDYAIGDLEYADLLWRPKVPAHQGHFADRVGVVYPPRCPVCGTGLLEVRVGDREYEWRCPSADFLKRSKESMRDASIAAEYVAQRKWEKFKVEQARSR